MKRNGAGFVSTPAVVPCNSVFAEFSWTHLANRTYINVSVFETILVFCYTENASIASDCGRAATILRSERLRIYGVLRICP